MGAMGRNMSTMARAAAAATLVVACLVASPALAQYHGAIGYSPTTGAMGWSFDYPNAEEAQKIALMRCAEHAADCKIAVRFRDGCGAVVVGEEAQTAAGSPSRSDAVLMAMRRCSARSDGCKVRRWVCTTRSMY